MLLALLMKLEDSLVVNYRRKNVIKDMKVAHAVASAFKRCRANEIL